MNKLKKKKTHSNIYIEEYCNSMKKELINQFNICIYLAIESKIEKRLHLQKTSKTVTPAEDKQNYNTCRRQAKL